MKLWCVIMPLFMGWMLRRKTRELLFGFPNDFGAQGGQAGGFAFRRLGVFHKDKGVFLGTKKAVPGLPKEGENAHRQNKSNRIRDGTEQHE